MVVADANTLRGRVVRNDWRRERELEEIAERRAKQDANRDEELEQCFVAYHAFRIDGGQSTFEDFRRDWMTKRGGVS